MNDKILLRAIGEFEVYQFLEGIDEFTEFYKANLDNFSIFEIANLSDIEITQVNDEYSVYDMTLEHTGEHFWLLKDNNSGMYEPLDDEEQVEQVIAHLKNED